MHLAVDFAWRALNLAGEDWAPVAQAHLLLGSLAVALGEPVDALNFSVGALAAAGAIPDEALQQRATHLRQQIEERWGDGPTRELARTYQLLL